MSTSPGSSSTSRTFSGRSSSVMGSVLIRGHRVSGFGRGVGPDVQVFRDQEVKGSTGTGAFPQPDPAPVELDDLAAQRQADARPAVFVAQVQPLEDGEDPLGVLLVDADAVVGDGEQPLLALRLRADLDARPALGIV